MRDATTLTKPFNCLAYFRDIVSPKLRELATDRLRESWLRTEHVRLDTELDRLAEIIDPDGPLDEEAMTAILIDERTKHRAWPLFEARTVIGRLAEQFGQLARGDEDAQPWAHLAQYTAQIPEIMARLEAQLARESERAAP